MALLALGTEPLAFLQALRSLALGVVALLRGAATTDERAFVRRELELLERELAGGPGLLEDGGLGTCEDCVAAAFAHLGLAARAAGNSGGSGPRETELFLQACARDKLERRLLALWRRVQGNAVVALERPLLERAVERHRPRRPALARLGQKLSAVLGAGLLCLLCEAGLTEREPALLLGVWGERVGALHLRVKEALAQGARYFREQAQEDVEQAAAAAAPGAPLAPLAAALLRQLEQNYDWLCWAVMAWQPHHRDGGGEEEEEEAEEGGEATAGVLARGDFVTGRAAAAAAGGVRLLACFRESPTALDRARARQLIGELEWKLPNPPPEVYATLEAEPARARGYLARRMLQKLAEGLGPGVTLLVVPGKLEMKSGFPADACFLHEYRHRLASGTVCVFG